MAGYDWGDWAFAQYSSADVDAVALADGSTLTVAEISLNGKAACEVGVTAVEDNTGSVDGKVRVYVLGYGATGWQAAQDGPAFAGQLNSAQNAFRHLSFSVSPAEFGSFKVLVENDCGQEVAVSLKYRTATFSPT